MRVVVLGAGSIGCFVGGCWQVAGGEITLVGRASTAGEIAAHGLTVSASDGWEALLPPIEVNISDDTKLLSDADLIVLSVKSTATRQAAYLVSQYSAPQTPVLSLQNGISNVGLLRQSLPGRPIFAGMVGFNVVHLGNGRWQKATAGEIICQKASETEAIAALTAGSPCAVHLADDMQAVAWGKLLLNLNNAINALSGLPLAEQLTDRNYRRVLAASMREGLNALDAANITPAKVAALPPRFLPRFIDTPDWFFNSIGLRLQKIDAKARSSMADDFAAGKPTEVDFLNGEIVKLAAKTATPAPVNKRIVDLVRIAETGGKKTWSGSDLVAAVEL